MVLNNDDSQVGIGIHVPGKIKTNAGIKQVEVVHKSRGSRTFEKPDVRR